MMANFIGGTVVTEAVFTYPGLGRLLITGDQHARLPADPGLHPGDPRDLHAHQPPGRRALRLYRPAHRLRLRAAGDRRRCPRAPSALFDLTGQVALVTGASRGLGWAWPRRSRPPAPRSSSTAATRRRWSRGGGRWRRSASSAEVAAFDVTDGPAAAAAVAAHRRAPRPPRHPRSATPRPTVRKPLLDQTRGGLAGRHRRRPDRELAPRPRGRRAPDDPGRLRPHVFDLLRSCATVARPTITRLRRGEDRAARPRAGARGRAGARRRHRERARAGLLPRPRATPPCAGAIRASRPASPRARRPAAGAIRDELGAAALYLASPGLRLHDGQRAHRRRRPDRRDLRRGSMTPAAGADGSSRPPPDRGRRRRDLPRRRLRRAGGGADRPEPGRGGSARPRLARGRHDPRLRRSRARKASRARPRTARDPRRRRLSPLRGRPRRRPGHGPRRPGARGRARGASRVLRGRPARQLPRRPDRPLGGAMRGGGPRVRALRQRAERGGGGALRRNRGRGSAPTPSRPGSRGPGRTR